MSFAAWLVLAALPEIEPSRYATLVARYAAGERASVLAEARGFSEKELARELDQLRAWERTARRCERCPEKEAFFGFPLRAAILLHADLAELEIRSRTPVDESAARCGIGPHGVMAEELALLALLRPGDASFVRRWFRAMTLREHTEACLVDAVHWANTGLRWFPKDAPLFLARGAVEETAAALHEDVSPGSPGSPAGGRREITAPQRQYLGDALRDFDRALQSDKALAEARLRRGRVLWLLGDRAEAQRTFDAVLHEDGDHELLFRAHLFRGRGFEEEKRLQDAEADYRAALALAPQAQSAAVAVSYVSWLQGKTAQAKAFLDEALLRAGRRTAPDPYWDYSFGSTEEVDRLFDSLHEDARP
jgi:tetratricopeptide (TPR) repeat protein